MQTFVHYFLHLGFPLVLAYVFFRPTWRRAYLILLATMLVDVDHVLANPIFAANRCSIGFHPLHTYPAMLGYVVLLLLRRPFNIIGLGLLWHMATDLLDCWWMFVRCQACFTDAPAYGLLQALARGLGW